MNDFTFPVKSKGMKPWALVYGNSSEVKPIDKYCGGSKFRETDTGKVFRYDEDSKSWKEAAE